MHSVVPSSPPKHDQFQLLSCTSLRRLLEMPKAVTESPIRSFSSPQAPLRDIWRCSHDRSCGLTPFDQSVCHIKSAWLLVTLQLCLNQTQPIEKILGTQNHIIVLPTFFSLSQQQKLIHELYLSRPSSKFSCWDHWARLLQTRNQTRSQECVPGSPTVWCVFRLGSWPCRRSHTMERTKCGFMGLTFLFRGLVKLWWHLGL